jgi:guanosine-3',5'-bis(diphosphate) 3'-pyrophosphohydrolase
MTSTFSPSHLWQEASAFASRKHRHQIRKDGVTPYASHVFRVCLTARQVFNCDDDIVLAAALLHDTIEDTTTDYDDLAERFGTAVADTVAALTKNMALPEARREAEYDAQIARADWRARIIKLADVYDNLSDVPNMPVIEVGKRRAEAIERAERALALAAPDAHLPVIARAIAAVRMLLDLQR